MKYFKTFCLTTVVWLLLTTGHSLAKDNDFMIAHYIDVGQGMSILLEFPKGAVLIDAGGQDNMKKNVITYLYKFFARRTDLNRTLNTVFITHQHVDHDEALQDVVSQFKVLNYVDNGKHNPNDSGQEQIWLENHTAALGIKYESVTFDQITAGHNLKGLTDNKIDAVSGSPTRPNIIVYSGAFAAGEISGADLGNPNNHSLLIKVIYGRSSFLFSGDLQEGGINAVLHYYTGTNTLKADVMQVGHHGSANAISADWLKAVSPHTAVISCGQWNYGLNPADSTAFQYTTYGYGHPNGQAITLLEQNIPDLRPHPIKAHVGTHGTILTTVVPGWRIATITHNIYATPWNGTIDIKATASGVYTVKTER